MIYETCAGRGSVAEPTARATNQLICNSTRIAAAAAAAATEPD